MRTLGFITTGVGVLIVVAAVTITLVSIPDIKRYLKMSRM